MLRELGHIKAQNARAKGVQPVCYVILGHAHVLVLVGVCSFSFVPHKGGCRGMCSCCCEFYIM